MRALDEHGATVAVDARTGRIAGFRRTFPEAEAGGSPEESVARAKAASVFASFGLDPLAWDVVSSKSEARKARKDTHVVFESRLERAGEATRRAVTGLAGDVPSLFATALKLPEEWVRAREKSTAATYVAISWKIAGVGNARRAPRRGARAARARRSDPLAPLASTRGASGAAGDPRAPRLPSARPRALRLAVLDGRLRGRGGRRPARGNPGLLRRRASRGRPRPRREERRGRRLPAGRRGRPAGSRRRGRRRRAHPLDPRVRARRSRPRFRSRRASRGFRFRRESRRSSRPRSRSALSFSACSCSGPAPRFSRFFSATL